jgi:hypothetical protein
MLEVALVLSEGWAKLLVVLVPSEGRGRGCIVERPGGAAVVDWKVVVLVVVAPGAERADVDGAVGTVLMSGSVWLTGPGAEDGEIPDCCMLCAIVVAAVDVSERLAGSVVTVDK